MISANVNSPVTSSMGRLFDAIAALLTLRNLVNYEGQAAIELEGIADKFATDLYEFHFEEGEINANNVIRRAVEDLLDHVPVGQISARFHLGVAQLILNVASKVRDDTHLDRVVLSGGVFQNVLLLKLVTQLLRASHFDVFTHKRVPPNDGGISLGQAAIANARLQARR
jgi:hydrogenase maturation protein HypF